MAQRFPPSGPPTTVGPPVGVAPPVMTGVAGQPRYPPPGGPGGSPMRPYGGPGGYGVSILTTV